MDVHKTLLKFVWSSEITLLILSLSLFCSLGDHLGTLADGMMKHELPHSVLHFSFSRPVQCPRVAAARPLRLLTRLGSGPCPQKLRLYFCSILWYARCQITFHKDRPETKQPHSALHLSLGSHYQEDSPCPQEVGPEDVPQFEGIAEVAESGTSALSCMGREELLSSFWFSLLASSITLSMSQFHSLD